VLLPEPGIPIKTRFEGVRAIDLQSEQLPYTRDEAVSGDLSVLPVSLELLSGQALFVPDSGDQDSEQRQGGDHRPPGAQRHRREEEHDEHSEVHGMPDDGIRTGHDDTLPLFHSSGLFNELLKDTCCAIS